MLVFVLFTVSSTRCSSGSSHENAVARRLRNPYTEHKLEMNKDIDLTSAHVTCVPTTGVHSGRERQIKESEILTFLLVILAPNYQQKGIIQLQLIALGIDFCTPNFCGIHCTEKASKLHDIMLGREKWSVFVCFFL